MKRKILIVIDFALDLAEKNNFKYIDRYKVINIQNKINEYKDNIKNMEDDSIALKILKDRAKTALPDLQSEIYSKKVANLLNDMASLASTRYSAEKILRKEKQIKVPELILEAPKGKGIVYITEKKIKETKKDKDADVLKDLFGEANTNVLKDLF